MIVVVIFEHTVYRIFEYAYGGYSRYFDHRHASGDVDILLFDTAGLTM